MARPSIVVNGGAAGVKASVSAAAAVAATLDSTDGVRQCAWSVISTDETSAAASYTLVQTGSVGQNVAFTSLGAGTALLLKVIVNAGVNQQTGLSDATGTSATVKVYVPTAAGLEVGCAGETYESDPTFGATGLINSGIRLASSLSPAGIPVKIVKAATTAALPANTRSGNVLTANANGAFAAIDTSVTPGVGDRFLAQNEGGGASHVNNGVYTLTTAGDAGNPWTATRATDLDDTSELVQGTTFIIQQGTTYAGKQRYLKTSGATINVTALEFDSAGDVLSASATARYLTASATAINANDQPIEDLAAGLVFACDADAPVRLRRDDASGTGTLDVLVVGRTNSAGGGAITIGTGVRWDIHDADETQVEAARIAAVATNVTAGAHAAKITFESADAGSLSTLGWWDVDGLHVSTDLIVAGTTTTVDSTSVTVADRLVVFNSSTGIIPVPASAAGFVIDRGSADGITKRDAPGVLWDEANSRFAVAYNTTLDQSTIGTYVAVKVGGLISPSLDNPSGAVAIGATATSAAVTPDTTFSGVLTELRPGITTTVTPGVIASNATTAATPSPLVQYGPALISSGGAWETGGGGSAKTIRGGFYTRGISSGTAGAEVVFIYDTGGGTFSEGGRITTNLPGVGGVGFVAPTLVCDGGNGIRFVSSSTDRGNVKWSGSAIEVNAGSNPITLASTSGTTIDTQASTLRVLSAPGTPASTAAAVTIDLARQNAEHTITENTTVTFSNAALGESGIVIFIQDGTGRTLTMPAASSSIEYIDSIEALTVTGIVDTTAATKTILKYYVMTGPKILFYYRATSAT